MIVSYSMLIVPDYLYHTIHFEEEKYYRRKERRAAMATRLWRATLSALGGLCRPLSHNFLLHRITYKDYNLY
jgi:hypothetical protein